MAFPVVEGVAETAVITAGTSHAITLPASIAATDLVLIIMDIGSTSATLNALTDWTESLDEAVANGLKIIRYTGAGVPSNPTFTSTAATRSASLAYRISGAHLATAPQIGTTATGTSTTPDPPAVTPTGGISKDYLFIAFAGLAGEEADDDTWSDVAPTNYTPSPPRQKACGIAGSNLGGKIVAAERQLTTGAAEDPGTFTVDVSAAWRAQTIIIHPDTAQTLSGALFTNAPVFSAGVVTPGAVTLGGSLFTSTPAFATGEVTQAGAQPLDGVLFALAPTFPVGVLSSTYALAGVEFTVTPTFPTGAVTSSFTLNGVTFTLAPTFPTGALSSNYPLTGVLFTNSPTFSVGAITVGATTLNGVLFTLAPTFPVGAVNTAAGPQTVNGVLFTLTATFNVGTLGSNYNLDGVALTVAPTFSVGALSTTFTVQGVVFTLAPTFNVGSVGEPGDLEGVLFVLAPTFFSGGLTQTGGSFWRPNPVAYVVSPAAYVVNPAAYDPVERDELPPWPIEVLGNVYVNAPQFPVGAVS
jgi:hypothetical protein